jgi:hypothetical protein
MGVVSSAGPIQPTSYSSFYFPTYNALVAPCFPLYCTRYHIHPRGCPPRLMSSSKGGPGLRTRPGVEMLVNRTIDLLYVILTTMFSDHILEARMLAKTSHKGDHMTTS